MVASEHGGFGVCLGCPALFLCAFALAAAVVVVDRPAADIAALQDKHIPKQSKQYIDSQTPNIFFSM